MPRLTKVKIEDLVAASKRYVDAQLKQADVNGNKLLTKTEARRLAKDLQDNFEASQFKLPSGSARVSDVAREFVVMMEAWAHAVDKNRDGAISTTEVKQLPRPLRDNVLNFIDRQSEQVSTAGAYASRDTTPASRIAAHDRAFGPSAVSYQDALARALQAVATDADSGLPGFVREFGGPDGAGVDDPKKLAAEVKALLKAGSIELVPVDEEIPTGEVNRDAWIFSISTTGQGDHGLWAIIDRQTGEASVTNFN
ncbi:MAG: hypothetical protein Q8N23_30510 [Archangium sp.]|nr:hypothetical protein [Archangium sp.]MDP3157044.1 hypothetical protein [Archangium sp.]MDP3575761.1 hypothetical protein [Archangium sp.]